MTARSPCSLCSPPAAASAPRCIAQNFFAKVCISEGVGQCQPLPRHIIFAFFFTLHHPNLQPKIVLSCTRVGSLGCFSPTCQSHLSAVKIERRERRGHPTAQLWSARAAHWSAVLTGSAHCIPATFLLTRKSPLVLSLWPHSTQFNKLGFYCVDITSIFSFRFHNILSKCTSSQENKNVICTPGRGALS